MGWNARYKSGIIVRQKDGILFGDTDLHFIEEMWLDGLEKAAINRRQCPGFIEFIQFESAEVNEYGVKKTGEFIGWTDGTAEFIIGISLENHCNHPSSRLNK